MDDFKVVALFLVLGITISSFVPVTSHYALFQPQYFRIPPVQQPYTPYGYYDIFKVTPDGRTVPNPAYPKSPSYPQSPPSYPQPHVPSVYSYFGTPVYDFRYHGLPFYPRGRPVFPPPPPPPFGPQDPFSTDKPEKDDGIEKLDKKAPKKKEKKPKKPEETTEDTTEPSEESATVNALDE